MAIDATEGGASANSYITEAEATSYLAGRMNTSAYDNATTDQRERAIRTAALWLDARALWIGDVKDQVTPQAMAWPRVYDSTVSSPEDILVLGAAIPKDLKNAQAELALYLLSSGEPQDTDELDSIKVGSLTIDFNEKQGSELLPDFIWSMISYLGSRRSTGATMKSVALSR